MFSSLWRRVGVYGQSWLPARPVFVRRNAASIVLFHRFFSSEIGNCNQTDVDGKTAKAVKDLLRNHGFNDSQISEVARLCYSAFSLKATNNILPKLKFFKSIGMSNAELPNFILRAPFLLSSSLDRQLIPCYNYLKGTSIPNQPFGTMLRSRPGILLTSVNDVLAPNLELLRELGVPVSSLRLLVTRCGSTLCRKHEKFKAFVEQAIEMGLNPWTRAFILGVHVLSGISKETWEHKWKVYRSFGLSDDDILIAFRKEPTIMALSERKIVKTLEFCLKRMSWNPSFAVNCPMLLLFSLETRIIPRCRVMEILINRGLVKNISPTTYLKISEQKFLIRYHHEFKDALPELKDVYIISKSSQRNIKNHVLVG